MKETRKRGISLILTLALVLGSMMVPGGSVKAAENVFTGNIARGKCVTVSSLEAGVSGNAGTNVTDGNEGTRWSCAAMKNGQPEDTAKQTEQWLTIDLKTNESTVSGIVVKFYNKVWATKYRIETADTETSDAWTEVASLERASQQETANVVDIFDDELKTTTVKRYVRFYFERVNIYAAGTGVSVTEIEINGSQEALPAASAADALNQISSIPDPEVDDTKVELPDAAGGYEIKVIGSDKEQIVSNDGTIVSHNIGDQKVTLLVEAAKAGDSTDTARRNYTITVPSKTANYPADMFPVAVNPNKEPEVIPSLQEWCGFDDEFTLKISSKIVINDAANVNLKAAAENMRTDLEEISGKSLSIVEGTEAGADDIYIESLPEDIYETGEEGYLLLVTKDGGIKIYAPTYTGCLYGTITVEQILWQDDDGNDSVPCGVTRDYPDYEIRGVMFDVGRIPHRLQYLKDYTKILLWYKMSEYQLHLNESFNYSADASPYPRNEWSGMHRLQSEKFPSLTSRRVYGGTGSPYEQQFQYFNEVYGDPTYTKEEYVELEELARSRGLELIPEFDTPSHATAYIEYVNENPDKIPELEGGSIAHDREQLELALQSNNEVTRKKAELAYWFMDELWSEYLEKDANGKATFNNSTVNIGVDEYWDKSNPTAYFDYIEHLVELVKSYGKTARMWGEIRSFGNTVPESLLALKDSIVIDHWSDANEDPLKRLKEGFRLVNIPQTFLYNTPGRNHKDMIGEEYLFKYWNPTIFSGGNDRADVGEPLLLGAKTTVWGDEFREGIVEADTHERMLRAVAMTAEKTWGGTNEEDEYVDYQQTFDKLKEGPGTKIAHNIDSKTENVVDYDLSETKQTTEGLLVKDMSGNRYDAVLTNGKVVPVDGKNMIEFNGSTVLTTPLTTLGYPYTVTFDVKATAGNTSESLLFSGYDGQLRAADQSGFVTMKRSFYTQNFGYAIPSDKTVTVTVVGTSLNTKFYVDGKLVKMHASSDTNKTDEWFSTFVFPMEEIGKGFHGYIGNIRAYNKAMQPEMIRGDATGMTEVNVALNANAYAERFNNSNPALNSGDLKYHPAWKATDGDRTDAEADSGMASTDPNSYWLSSANDNDYLMVDLGEEMPVYKTVLYWNGQRIGKDFNIQVSSDRKNWRTVKEVTNNTEAVTTVTFDETSARYVKMQGVQRTQNVNYYAVQEMEVYQKVDRAALKTAVEQARASVTVKEGEKISALARAVLEAADEAEELLGNVLTDQKDIDTAIAAMKKAGEEYKTNGVYEDVTGDWYYEYVQDAYVKGLMTGKSAGIFAPNEDLVRAQFAVIVWRMAGSPQVSYTNKFPDVANGQFYTQAVLWANSVGIITGYGNGNFGPNDPITRQQMMVMMYRYAIEYKKYQTDTPADKILDPFTDKGDLQNAKMTEAAKWCVSEGIVSGKNKTTLAPNGNTNRAECATIISRFEDYY